MNGHCEAAIRQAQLDEDLVQGILLRLLLIPEWVGMARLINVDPLGWLIVIATTLPEITFPQASQTVMHISIRISERLDIKRDTPTHEHHRSAGGQVSNLVKTVAGVGTRFCELPNHYGYPLTNASNDRSFPR